MLAEPLTMPTNTSKELAKRYRIYVIIMMCAKIPASLATFAFALKHLDFDFSLTKSGDERLGQEFRNCEILKG